MHRDLRVAFPGTSQGHRAFSDMLTHEERVRYGYGRCKTFTRLWKRAVYLGRTAHGLRIFSPNHYSKNSLLVVDLFGWIATACFLSLLISGGRLDPCGAANTRGDGNYSEALRT